MVEFGEKLKKAREGKGMTQQTIAYQTYALEKKWRLAVK